MEQYESHRRIGNPRGFRPRFETAIVGFAVLAEVSRLDGPPGVPCPPLKPPRFTMRAGALAASPAVILEAVAPLG